MAKAGEASAKAAKKDPTGGETFLALGKGFQRDRIRQLVELRQKFA